MDMISASVKRLWDVWDLRLLVLLSLTLQILLSVFGYRRKYVSLLWLNILVWSSYLMADQIAIIALSKLSDSQVGYDKGNALWAIWAPLLLLHLGGPDSITAFSLQDNQLWMRRLCSLGVQFYIAVNVILISWKHSWFSTMSILALVAGLIKYGERIWVLVVVSKNFTEDIMPFQFLGRSDVGIYNTEDTNYVRVLRLAHDCFLGFWRYMEYYDLRYNTFVYSEEFSYNSFSQGIAEFHDIINLFWKAIEVEMGLMFDVLYTKVAIRLGEVGWILRCITFSCTMTVLIGLIIRLISTREDQEKWHRADIAITEVLLVGALALEIYGIISLYLSSDWAMLWLINHKREKQAIQFRKRIPGIFLPKQYSCKNMAQFSLLDFCVKDKNQNVYLRSLLGKKYILNKYALPPVAFVPSDLFDPLLDCCRCLMSRHQSFGEEDEVWTNFFSLPLEAQIMSLHFQTELCTVDDAFENNRDSAVSQHTTAPSGSSSSWQKDKELCRTLSRYMMYLLVMRRWLLPVPFSNQTLWSNIDHKWKAQIVDGQNVRASFKRIVETQAEFKHLQCIESEDERWATLKGKWVRILCTAASKGHRNEHLQQLSQGCEFITFLWFFLPQSRILSDVNPVNQSHGMRAQREVGAGLGFTRVWLDLIGV